MFIRKWQRLFILVILCMPYTANACAVCFGAAESKLVHGATMGAAFLLGLTALVLSCFGYLIVYLRKKSNLYNKVKMNEKNFP